MHFLVLSKKLAIGVAEVVLIPPNCTYGLSPTVKYIAPSGVEDAIARGGLSPDMLSISCVIAMIFRGYSKGVEVHH